MRYLRNQNGRCPFCAEVNIKYLKSEYYYGVILNIMGLHVLITFQCSKCNSVFQEVYECQYIYTQEPEPWGSDFEGYPKAIFEDVEDLLCENCGTLWGVLKSMEVDHDTCPFCGSDKIRRN